MSLTETPKVLQSPWKMNLRTVFVIVVFIRHSRHIHCQSPLSSVNDSGDNTSGTTSSSPYFSSSFSAAADHAKTLSEKETNYFSSSFDLQRTVSPSASLESPCHETTYLSATTKGCSPIKTMLEQSVSPTNTLLHKKASMLTDLPTVSQYQRSATPQNADVSTQSIAMTASSSGNQFVFSRNKTNTEEPKTQEASVFAIVFGVLGAILVFGILGMMVRNVYVKNKNKVKKIKRPKGSKKLP
ncbi:uncharacterized protein LOC135696818 isoform X2 [Rhopilema esculentum]|uniref:uncharacterized protein LOC135696818 isoform X2 n=1 Tax=Rhopilema esculentum TaxID=499914 RepID=UPI0031CE1578